MRAKERAGKEPLLSPSLFRNRTSNLGLITQNTQWLMLMGISFTVSAYLQVVRGYNAIETGVILAIRPCLCIHSVIAIVIFSYVTFLKNGVIVNQRLSEQDQPGGARSAGR